MKNFERRVRTIMKRENLSYNALADYADASTQAVYKWLSKGSMSDEKAMTLSHKIGLDWLWLKHGISRVPVDTLYDIVLSSTSNYYLSCWNTLEIVALGDGLLAEMDYKAEEVIGKCILDFAPNPVGNRALLMQGQKIIYVLSGMLEHSYRANVQGKHRLRAVELRSKAMTTDENGLTYGLLHVNFVEPNGRENKMSSFKLHRTAWQPPSPVLIEELCSANPEMPWLKEFLLK